MRAAGGPFGDCWYFLASIWASEDVRMIELAGPTNSLASALVAAAAGRLPYTPTAVRAPGVFLVLRGAPCVLLRSL